MQLWFYRPVMMDHSEIAAEGELDAVREIAQVIVNRLPVRVLKSPSPGMVMVRQVDPLENIQFLLGEAYVTECEVDVGGLPGYGCVLGSGEDRALCSALLDAVIGGGHAMAAGFTVRNELMPELVAKLQAIAERELAHRDLRPVLRADVEIVLSDLKPSLLPVIDQLQPTGMENPDAVFVSRNLMVKSHRSVGADSKHLKLAVSDGRVTYDAIAFRMGAWANELPARVDLLYSFERNSYNGFESLQLNVKDLKPAQ